ncbi:MAG: rhodanese-like domain-containing protein, partial [Desulfobacterales bacterium]|nr:rhodanese-like domain-containing protein [Desulfobacterales bacterium]
MPPRLMMAAALAAFFAVAGLTGCATHQAATTAAEVLAEAAFEPFHDIVDMTFVEQHVSIPMADNVMLIDSRPYKPKYFQGHIPMAVSIPDSQFDKMTGKLPADKSSLLIFYCEGLHCKLSHKSARKAEALGYTNVKVFAEGYPAWVALAGPAPAATAATPGLKKGAEEGSIDHAEFRRILREEPKSVYLVDVRDADEFSKGSLKGAVNIPVDHLQDRIKALPADKPVIFVCGTGARSGESFYMVQDLRPELKNVYYVDGEMTIGKDGSF